MEIKPESVQDEDVSQSASDGYTPVKSPRDEFEQYIDGLMKNEGSSGKSKRRRLPTCNTIEPKTLTETAFEKMYFFDSRDTYTFNTNFDDFFTYSNGGNAACDLQNCRIRRAAAVSGTTVTQWDDYYALMPTGCYND